MIPAAADPVLTLANLRAVMTREGYTPRTLASKVPIHVDRISDLAAKDIKRRPEPWLDEAYFLARVLGTNDICTLIGLPMEDITLTEDARGDLNIWRTGCTLPLSHAVRLSKRFGMADPYDLNELIRMRLRNPVTTGLWNMPPAPGGCQWCGRSGANPHADACAMNNLWGPRDLDVETTLGAAPRPRVPGVRQLGAGRLAPGLKRLRLSLKVSHQFMATSLGCSLAHYGKMENLISKLTPENAQALGHKFGINPADLFTAPTPTAPVVRELAPPPVVEVAFS